MKFVVTWKPRFGESAAENEASVARVLEVYRQWTPPSNFTIHQFVARVDGEGGFVVVEGDKPASQAQSIFYKFFPFIEIAVYPVLDIGEAGGLALQWQPGVRQRSMQSGHQSSQRAARADGC